MRKNSVRKWLHAILDLLPLLVIPIFAIYTRNENYNSNIELEVETNKQVSVTQLIKNPVPTSLDNWQVQNTNIASLSYNNEEFIISVNATASGTYQQGINQYNLFDASVTHTYLLKITLESTDYSAYRIEIGSTVFTVQNGYNEFKLNNLAISSNRILVYPNSINLGTYKMSKINVFDMTDMDVDDLTPQQFNYIYTEDVYKYGINYKVLARDITITYNDTDVGSQFVYTLYNATDKYFNCTNLFNLEQVWNWVQLNLFGGNAPLMVYVVWQVIVYEFFMDLIFLLYSVFMFVIDFAENCLERPFDKIRRL